MGRNNEDFQSSVLYHGSPHAIAVGDVVVPSKKGGYQGEVAYATPDLEIARNHAKKSAHIGEGAVYTVEPVDSEEEQKTSKIRGGDRLVRMSRVGFRVTGKAE